MIQTENRSLKQLFNDVDYAWNLLEGEVRLQTSPDVSSEDVSQLLQLYMKGVEKMNSFLDYRQAFFKERVMTLMSRPTVMKTLNNKNVMSKKNGTATASTNKSQLSPQTSQKNSKPGSNKKIEPKPQLLQLKQKKRQIQVRLAYGVEQTTPDALHKMMNDQAQKQVTISSKILKIVQNHEQTLMKRVKQRKLRTLAAKSLSNAIINNFNEPSSNHEIPIGNQDHKNTKQGDYFGSCILLQDSSAKKQQRSSWRKKYRSHSLGRSKKKPLQQQSPLRRTISYNMAVHISKQNIKLWQLNGVA